MNTKRKRKLIGIIIILLLLGVACGLILFALKKNINLFFTPTQLTKTVVKPEQVIRLGGYVKNHSVQFDESGQTVHFILTDRVNEIVVTYQGVLPNLFREGQTVVAMGKLSTPEMYDSKETIDATKDGNNRSSLEKNIFKASQILAKHDEKYMPASLAKDIKEART